jgi:hypothetical protein
MMWVKVTAAKGYPHMARSSNPVRTIVTIVMDVLIAWVIVLLVHLVVGFFGIMADTQWGAQLLKLTSLAVLPVPVASVSTPYGGEFDVAAAATVGILLVAEWALSMVRRTV